MRITISSQYLAAYLFIGWRCILVGEGTCVIEHMSSTPPMACRECSEMVSYRQHVRFGGLCEACSEPVVTLH